MWRWVHPALLVSVACVLILLSMFGVTQLRRSVRKGQRNASLLDPVPPRTPTPTLAERLAPLWSEVDLLWDRRAWQEAIATLERIYALDPTDEEVRKRLSSAHFQLGQEFIASDQMQEALAEFNQAIRIYAGDEHLQRVRQHLIHYVQGRESYQQRDWNGVIAQLTPIFQENPDFKDIRLMLYQAHYQQGLALEQKDELAKAKEEYFLATVAYPSGNEAAARLAMVTDILRMRKRIEIDVSQQRLIAWEKDQIVFDFICSTGKVGTPTKRGTFEVLDKIPEAYSSVWDLRMPWWLGIYWAGGSENGIHALPILSNGRTLWSGYLGRPISYGCIVLDTAAARKLYNWAEIGTPVVIHD